MIITDRTITVRKGIATINEPVVLYRGDYEVVIRFKISNSKLKFMAGANMIESEKAAYGQLAILTPYGGNIFSSMTRCSEGAVAFVVTQDMLDQIEEVGLYSFQIRLFDANRESRITIPPVEFGIEIREPIASEDHDNEVNNAIVGYSIAKVVDPSEENVGPTFDHNGQYNKTDWKTGDRISQGKLNKIEDAIDVINQNEKALDKRVGNNYNVLQNQIDNMVIESGSTDAEVEQARGKYNLLNQRLNAMDETDAELVSQLTQKETKTTLEIYSAKMTETGDCMVLKTKNGITILCDTGSSSRWNEVDTFLSKNVDKLDYIIITHYHGDHVGNLENILKKYKTDNCIAILPCEPDFSKMNVNGTEFKNATQNTYDICDDYGVVRKIPSEGEVLEIDDIKLKFMNCSLDIFTNYYNEVSEFAKNNETDYNNFSLVFEVIHNKNKILFTGDINIKAQETLMPYVQKYNLLKCQHHSVDTFFYPPFMLKTYPDIAFSNNNGQSSLPHSEITRFFLSRGIPYYVTAQSGDIKLISDGFHISCDNRSYFVNMTMKELLSSLGVDNYMYYQFSDISKTFNYKESSLEEMIGLMTTGSCANVNFTCGDGVTPSFISSWNGSGFIQKPTENKATIILFDNNPNTFNCYIGLWHSTKTEVIWYKLGSDERIEQLNKKVNVTLYNTYSSMSDLGITTSSTALEMVKAMPPSSLYSGFVAQAFDSKLDVYGAMVDIKKSSNNLIAKITMTSANPKNMAIYEGIYHQNVGDYITWKNITRTDV